MDAMLFNNFARDVPGSAVASYEVGAITDGWREQRHQGQQMAYAKGYGKG
jgi:hypothetical protein